MLKADLMTELARLPHPGKLSARMWLRSPDGLVEDLDALKAHYAPSWSRNRWLVMLLGQVRDELKAHLAAQQTQKAPAVEKVTKRKMGSGRGK